METCGGDGLGLGTTVTTLSGLIGLGPSRDAHIAQVVIILLVDELLESLEQAHT